MRCMGFAGSYRKRERHTQLTFLLPAIWNADVMAKFPKSSWAMRQCIKQQEDKRNLDAS